MAQPEPEPVTVAIVIRANRVLMIKRAPSSEGLSWVFPGGKVERGEGIEQAAIREVMEEVGVACLPRERLGQRIHPQTGRHVHYVLCGYLSGEGVSREPDKISDVQWMTSAEVAANVTSSLFEPVAAFIRKLAAGAQPKASSRHPE